MKKNEQNRKLITLSLDKEIKLNFKNIDGWMYDILKLERSEVNNNLENSSTKEKDILQFVSKLLTLRSKLAQSAKIPLFDRGEIVSLNEDNKKYKIDVLIPFVHNISGEMYKKLFNFSLNLLIDFNKLKINNDNVQKVFAHIEKEIIKKSYKFVPSGKSTIPILSEAFKNNIPFKHIGTGVYILGWGKKSRIMNRSQSDKDSAIGAGLSNNKISTATLIKDAGLPSPIHILPTSEKDIKSFVEKYKFPVVIKPADLDRGEGVTVDINDYDTLIKAYNNAKKLSKSKLVILEKHVPGVCHRIFISNEEVLYVVKRLPKSIKANGKNNIKELISIANKIEMNTPPWDRTEFYPYDQMAINAIKEAGYDISDIPKKNTLIPLRKIESTQWGGYDEDMTSSIHPENINIALRAAKLFNLENVGVDIISDDISVPWYENGAIINEVNFSPLYGGGEISRGTIKEFFDKFIVDDGRIQIKAYIGGTQALKKAKSYQKKQIKCGRKVFLSTYEETISDRNEKIIFPFNSLYKRVSALILDSDVEELVIVIMNDEFLHTGMPIDCLDELNIESKRLKSSINQSNYIKNHEYENLLEILNKYLN